MWPNPQFPSDLVTFAEEILNGKLYFFGQCGWSWSFHVFLIDLIIIWNLQHKCGHIHFNECIPLVNAGPLNILSRYCLFTFSRSHFAGTLTEIKFNLLSLTVKINAHKTFSGQNEISFLINLFLSLI